MYDFSFIFDGQNVSFQNLSSFASVFYKRVRYERLDSIISLRLGFGDGLRTITEFYKDDKSLALGEAGFYKGHS